MKFFLLILFLLSSALCKEEASLVNNVKIGMTAPGLQNLDGLIDTLGSYLLGPIKVPLSDYKTSNIDGSATFRNMTVFDMEYSSFIISIVQGKGFQIEIKQFGAKLNYTCDYQIDIPSEKGSFTSLGSISDSDFKFELAITSSNGIPVAKIDKISLNVKNLQTGFPGWLGDVVKFLSPIIEYFVDHIVPSNAEKSINTILETKIAEYFPFSVHLDNQNLTTLNISLTSAPLFQIDEFVFNINVDIFQTGKEACGLKTHNIPFNHQGELDAIVDIQVIQCGLSALTETGALHNIVMDKIEKYLPLHDRMGINVEFGTQNTFAIENEHLAINLDLLVDFLQNKDGKLVKMITIEDDQDVTFNLSLTEEAFQGIAIEAIIQSLKTGLSSPFISKDLPEFWSKQIENSKWDTLSKEADEFILKTIPKSFKYIIPNTLILTNYLPDAKLVTGNGYLSASIDIKPPLGKICGFSEE